jgi:hypothetical protein
MNELPFPKPKLVFSEKEIKHKYYLQYEITKYDKDNHLEFFVIKSKERTICVGDFTFTGIPDRIVKMCMELKRKYGYNIQQSILLNSTVMAKKEKKNENENLNEHSTIPVPLNQLVEGRSVYAFNKGYEDLVQYAAEKKLKKPNKGLYLSYIVNEGMKTVNPEYYYKD